MKMTRAVKRVGAPTVAVVACLAAIMVSYCGKKDEEAVVAKPTFSSLYSVVFAGCAECHKPGTEVYTNSVQNLDLSSSATAYASLTSTISASVKSRCSSTYYVKPSAPANSAVVAVFDESVRASFGDDNSGCEVMAASEMGAAPISAENLAVLKQWITEGAQNN
jgi:hypothetical protein